MAFELVRGRRSSNEVNIAIWTRNIPVRVSVFLWRLLNLLLPFPEILQSHGFSLASKCPHCLNEDSMEHCFLECFMAVGLWNRLTRVGDFGWDFSSGFPTLFESVQLESFKELAWFLLAIGFWCLWKCRNQKLFEEKEVGLDIILRMEEGLCHEYTISSPIVLPSTTAVSLQHLPFLHMRQKSLAIQSVAWRSPAFPFYKLNVDGSSMGNPGHAGGGFILRDWNGGVVFAGSLYFGFGTSLHAEIFAMLRALQECNQRGFGQLLVESDSQLLIQMLAHRKGWPWHHFYPLQELSALVLSTQSSISHVFREANAAADFLSKFASQNRTSMIYDNSTIPPAMRGLLKLDQVACPYLRRRFK